MLPEELVGKVDFRPALYHKIYNFLKDNDPKMIFIYGEIDPWSAAMVPAFKGKKNEHPAPRQPSCPYRQYAGGYEGADPYTDE